MKQAQRMQQDMQKVQSELEQASAEGSAGGGMVKAVVSGKFELTAITINPQVVNPQGVDILQDMVCAAVNDAVRKIQAHIKTSMAKVTGGMNLPGGLL
jgi:nucleoid-associated protein EbfC